MPIFIARVSCLDCLQPEELSHEQAQLQALLWWARRMRDAQAKAQVKVKAQ